MMAERNDVTSAVVLSIPRFQYSIMPFFRVPLSWMMSPVNFLESGTVHVSVDLRRRDIRMAKH